TEVVADRHRSEDLSLTPGFDPGFPESHCARHRPLQELVRKAELDVARFFQPLPLLVAEADIEGAEVVLELTQRAHAEDGRRHARVEQCPGDRDLRRRPLHFPGDFFDHLSDLEATRSERAVRERYILAGTAG